MKWMSDILINTEIKDIIADKDRVWLIRNDIINDPNQRNINISFNIKFKIKENQIIHQSGNGRYYVALIQFGQIVIKRNQKDEVRHYIQMLKDMGIIPPEGIKRYQ